MIRSLQQFDQRKIKAKTLEEKNEKAMSTTLLRMRVKEFCDGVHSAVIL